MLKQILIILIAILLFTLGGISGLFYQAQKDAFSIEQAQQPQAPDKLASLLSSKMITAITASGKVTDVTGDTVTISADNKSLKFNLSQNTVIYFMQDKTHPTQQKAERKDIIMGETLFSNLKLLPNGQFQALYIFIQAK